MYSVAIYNNTKLNNMLRFWPHGTVGVYPFFREFAITPQLIADYQKNGWVKSIAGGAYKRFDDEHVHWQGALFAVQHYLKLRVHVGAVTALEAAGFAQYVSPSNKKAVWLFGERSNKLPRWFLRTDWGVETRFQTSNLFKADADTQIDEREIERQKLLVSSPERAILETLSFVPKAISFEYASELLENLQTLRPQVIGELLRKCRSVKVKRLFLFLADHAKLPWFDEIDKKKIDLGSGFRSIVKPGVLDSKYKITVPASFKEKNEK
jgi:hypothetical protein